MATLTLADLYKADEEIEAATKELLAHKGDSLYRRQVEMRVVRRCSCGYLGRAKLNLQLSGDGNIYNSLRHGWRCKACELEHALQKHLRAARKLTEQVKEERARQRARQPVEVQNAGPAVDRGEG